MKACAQHTHDGKVETYGYSCKHARCVGYIRGLDHFNMRRLAGCSAIKNAISLERKHTCEVVHNARIGTFDAPSACAPCRHRRRSLWLPFEKKERMTNATHSIALLRRARRLESTKLV